MTVMTASPPLTLVATSLLTPAGPLGVVLEPDGTVRAAGFGELDVVLGRFSLAAGATEVRAVGVAGVPEAAASLLDAVERYSAGDVGALDTIPVRQPGGPFFQEAWRQMRLVPAGSTVSYAVLAARSGRPAAVRAAGSGCARNLVAPFVPCHRVVRTDGTLGGYAFGLDAKRALLAHEGAPVPR